MSNEVFVLPASPAQELLWLLHRADPGLTAYNVVRTFRVAGRLDTAALQRALDGVVARHEVLRTTYGERDGRAVQLIAPERTVPLLQHDLRDLAPEQREGRALGIVRERERTAFDLAHDPLLRGVLIRLDESDWMLVLETHHIASDGWSGGVMLRDMSELYAAELQRRAPSLPDLPIQYADFAGWQHDELEQGRLAELLAWWRSTLSGATFTLDLPTDRPRPMVSSFEGDRRAIVLPPETAHAVKRFAQERGATLYQTLLAAYQALLHRYSGQDDIVVGSPVAGRDRPETEHLVGYFANTLVLRTRFGDDPGFGALTDRVRETCLGAWEHQEVPLEQLALELRGERPSHVPLFQVVFTMLDNAPAVLSIEGATLTPIRSEHGTSKFDLVLFAADRPDGLRLTLFYRTDLFDGAAVDRMLGHLRTLLEAGVREPARPVSRLPMLTEPELAQMAAWNDTARPLARAAYGIHELITAQAQRDRSAVAVVAPDGRLTYGELDRRGNQLAHHLRDRGVAPGDTVGLCLERSCDSIVALVGILKAGAAYVPLVPEVPPARLAQQLAESGARLVVTHERHRTLLPPGTATVALDHDAAAIARRAETAPLAGVRPEHRAYVLFTSGSTGTPKGVAVTHGNLLHYIDAITPVLGVDRAQRPWHFGTVSTLAADLGHTSLFPSLASGGTLHLIGAEETTDAARFGDYVASHPLDVLKITPGHLRALLAGPRGDAILPREVLVLGGEACSWDLATQLVAAGRCRVVNHYGPTETTVGASVFPLDRAALVRAGNPVPQTVPIGAPLPRVLLRVLDGHLQRVPVGVPGELYIGGAGVAEGYWKRPELTAERFVRDPFSEEPGARLYRTGDRVRRLSTGEIEFLGRVDFQVKIRGYRVELGEIELVVAELAAVRSCAVLLRDTASDAPQLVAYVVADSWDESAARAAVSSRLPDYMVPTTWIRLDVMPLNANGKVDRGALPAPHLDGPAAPVYTAPRDEIEQTLANMWAEVLKRDVSSLGVHDSFLDLGGHSLTAIRILGRVSRECGVRLPLRQLFEQPTIAQLADSIRQSRAAGAVDVPATSPRLAPISRDAFRRSAARGTDT